MTHTKRNIPDDTPRLRADTRYLPLLFVISKLQDRYLSYRKTPIVVSDLDHDDLDDSPGDLGKRVIPDDTPR